MKQQYLHGVPNAPSVYSPSVNPDLAKKRQSHVLNKLVEYGYISEQDANNVKNISIENTNNENMITEK